MQPTVFCPDCQQDIPADGFVAHREADHPPATKQVWGAGAIDSQTRFGTDPPEAADEKG
jgi:hypothetical protein